MFATTMTNRWKSTRAIPGMKPGSNRNETGQQPEWSQVVPRNVFWSLHGYYEVTKCVSDSVSLRFEFFMRPPSAYCSKRERQCVLLRFETAAFSVYRVWKLGIVKWFKLRIVFLWTLNVVFAWTNFWHKLAWPPEHVLAWFWFPLMCTWWALKH